MMAKELASDVLNLPKALRQALQTMVDSLEQELGEALVSVVLHGSAVRNDWREGSSDVNVLVIVTHPDAKTCQTITRPLQTASRRWPIKIDLLSPRDIERSADVFPLRFLNIQRNHHVLAGEDLLTDLDIAWDHLRLRVEQQLKEMMFDMRSSLIEEASTPERQLASLKRNISSFASNLGALLFLRGGEWWLSSKSAIFEDAAEQLDLDQAMLATMLDIQRGEKAPDREQLLIWLDHFLELVAQTAHMVDRLEEEHSS